MSEENSCCLPSINSAFQPILSLAHQAPVGYEALLRPWLDGKPCSPLEAFRRARLVERTGEFERECVRCHAGHFARFADDESVLFINVQPEVLVHPIHGPGLIADILGCGIPPARLAIEVLETPQPPNRVLVDAVAQLRLHGFLIALDDFGAGDTNLSRVWDLRPDVVKLDRELIRQAATSYRNARSLLRLVELLHETGTLVAVEGVETEAEALLCLDCDADFAQGYYFGRPSALADKSDLRVSGTEFLPNNFQSGDRIKPVADLVGLQPYWQAFQDVTHAVCLGLNFAESATRFLSLALSLRMFLLDQNGTQIGSPVESQNNPIRRQSRFPMLTRRAGANWSKRPYFRNAVSHPGETVVSEPYVTSGSMNLCVTLAVCVETDGAKYVICGDVLFQELGRH
ncbi:EAL domain-containing protein [Paraburkholderia sediminicola]|uniref:EAL domain-containing protein n=1 Tax=Paraburkholderia rhynchosiae TaxID=487049 RepID=A0ACC7NQH4_9BURK